MVRWLGALCILGVCRLISADIWLRTSTFNMDPIPDMPADFGPDLPDAGVEGMLRMAEPEDACKPLVTPDFSTPWVALISRQQLQHSDNCTFDVKVANAQAAGAIAAIVYDNIFESLIIMSKPADHPSPGIPAVFVTFKAGLLMRKLLSLDGLSVTLTPVDTSPLMSLVVSAACGLIASTLVMVTVYSIRSWHNWRAGRMPPVLPPLRVLGPSEVGLAPDLLHALPVLIYSDPDRPQQTGDSADTAVGEGTSGKAMSCSSSDIEESVCCAAPPGVHAGETKRVCIICLEQYEDADKIRILPCYHRFHMSCVDQWLSTKRVCPVCKHDSAVSLTPLPMGGAGGGAARVGFGLRSLWQRASQRCRSLAGGVGRLRWPRSRSMELAEPLLPVTATSRAGRGNGSRSSAAAPRLERRQDAERLVTTLVVPPAAAAGGAPSAATLTAHAVGAISPPGAARPVQVPVAGSSQVLQPAQGGPVSGRCSSRAAASARAAATRPPSAASETRGRSLVAAPRDTLPVQATEPVAP